MPSEGNSCAEYGPLVCCVAIALVVAKRTTRLCLHKTMKSVTHCLSVFTLQQKKKSFSQRKMVERRTHTTKHVRGRVLKRRITKLKHITGVLRKASQHHRKCLALFLKSSGALRTI